MVRKPQHGRDYGAHLLHVVEVACILQRGLDLLSY